MATAKRLPSGSYRAQVFDYTDDAGKRHYKSFTANTKKEAEYMAAEYAMDKKAPITNNLTFQKALEGYISSKTPILSPATIRGYKNIQTMLSKKYSNFCSLNIFELTTDNIQSLINIINKNRSPKTVRNYHGLITAVMSTHRPDFAINTTLPQKVRPDLYIPSDDDIRRLMQSARNTELEVPIMLAAFGTMRRGEICALTLSDVKGNIIHVHHSIVEDSDGKLTLKAPKTYSSDRFVELPQFVIDKIMNQGYITKLKPHSITIMFDRLLTKNGIPHFRFHDLRHYSASVQHSLGIPDAYIMARGGWSSDTVLKSVYRHAMTDRQKDMSSIANNHFESVMQHEMQHDNKKTAK